MLIQLQECSQTKELEENLYTKDYDWVIETVKLYFKLLLLK